MVTKSFDKYYAHFNYSNWISSIMIQLFEAYW